MTEAEKERIRDDERIRIRERRSGRRGFGYFFLLCLAGIAYLIWSAARDGSAHIGQ